MCVCVCVVLVVRWGDATWYREGHGNLAAAVPAGHEERAGGEGDARYQEEVLSASPGRAPGNGACARTMNLH